MEDFAKRYRDGSSVASARQDIMGTGVSIKLTRAMEILAGTPELAKYWKKEDSGTCWWRQSGFDQSSSSSG